MAAVETNNQLTDNFLSIQNAKPDDKKKLVTGIPSI